MICWIRSSRLGQTYVAITGHAISENFPTRTATESRKASRDQFPSIFRRANKSDADRGPVARHKNMFVQTATPPVGGMQSCLADRCGTYSAANSLAKAEHLAAH